MADSSILPDQTSFLSTLPARGATADNSNRMGVSLISIHAPREGSDQNGSPGGNRRRISIHAPREGSDQYAGQSAALYEHISIHAPREGSDL